MTASIHLWGSSWSSWPTATATAAWMAKANVAPIHTSRGRYRLPMMRVAIMVLSGNSATKMTAKTVATTLNCTYSG